MKFCKKKKYFNKAFSILLLLFFSFVISFPSYHELSHFKDLADSHTECSIEADEDACHQFIYHLNNDVKCPHKAHFKNANHCELCSSILYLNLFTHKQSALKSGSFNKETKANFHQQEYLSFYLFNEDLRGPPFKLSI